MELQLLYLYSLYLKCSYARQATLDVVQAYEHAHQIDTEFLYRI